MTGIDATPRARPVTHGPRHHFFGYYDKTPWDASGRFMLGMEVGFMDRRPSGDDPLTIGIIDLENDCAFHALGESRAWCWQPGCMLQWLASAPDRLIIYNDRRDDRFVAAFYIGSQYRPVHPKTPEPRPTFRIAYIARAVTPGQFVLPAGVVEDMYAPGIIARTGMGKLVIAPEK